MAIIGIDLGTTNSVLSIFEGGKPVVIANAEGSRTTPSVVAFSETEGTLVGDMARRQSLVNPKETIYSIKRFMGKRFDEVPESDRKSVPYETCDQLNGDLGVRIHGKIYSPSEISAQILAKFKTCAEQYLGQPVKEAVITVPAYFNDAQRRATQVAGEIAGLTVRRIINEPTAAALAYGVDQSKEEKIAIYDFGGGTFDISILELGDGVIEVLSTYGDSHLGGDDIDQAIVNWLLTSFQMETGMDIRNDAMILQRVREAAEKAKMELSSMVQTEIYLPFLTADASGPKHLKKTLSRAELEQLMKPLVQKTLDCCKHAFDDAGLKPSDVAQVLLVGGSTRIPLVQSEVERYFGRAPNHSLNPDEVVAIGAGIEGGVLAGDVHHDILLLDVTSLTLGVEANGGLMIPLIERNTTIPAKKTKLFSTTVDNQESVTINVYQGERKFANENRFLGQFELSGIEPAPRAVPQIEVCFDIDANGVIRVSATNKKTNKEESLVLMGAGGLSDEEIRHAVEDAEAAREADEVRKAKVVARNKVQGLDFSIARMMREQSALANDTLIADSKAILEKADAILVNDDATTEAFEAIASELSTISCQWHELIYAKEKEDREREEAEKAAQQQQQQPDPNAQA